MSQNAPPSSTPKVGNFMSQKLAGLPVWSWGLIVLAGVGVGFFFLNRKQAATASPASSPAQQAVQDVTPTSEQVPNTTGDQVFIVPSPTSPPGGITVPPTGGDGTAAQTYTIRQPGKAPAYDNNNAGPPIWSAPGANTIGQIPWGSVVTSTGIPQTGPSNTGQPGGSDVYYPVTFNGVSGFVSRFDVVGVGAGGPRSPRYTANALSALGEYNG